MPHPIPTQVQDALRDMHPSPFIQAAILRVYLEAPGLLDEVTAANLSAAYAASEKGA